MYLKVFSNQKIMVLSDRFNGILMKHVCPSSSKVLSTIRRSSKGEVSPLTAGDGVPGSAIDDVVVRLEVLVVADTAVGVG